ncbi:MAG: MMPL family transporter, partial [Bacteroidales bacterium]|nr:MMPL family transporter [Bacteroidales bacterium]
GISIKPSTVLIFSIALGISVDNAIHFLSRYRLQLKLNNWRIKDSVIAALKETGFSMIYSSVVLFFGFIIFVLSSFGGTESLGYLIAFTLVVALFSNLFLLPSLILTLDKRITTKTFKEPLLEIFDEEEDIELDELQIEQIDTRGSA